MINIHLSFSTKTPSQKMWKISLFSPPTLLPPESPNLTFPSPPNPQRKPKRTFTLDPQPESMSTCHVAGQI